jgi:hypothetical protein
MTRWLYSGLLALWLVLPLSVSAGGFEYGTLTPSASTGYLLGVTNSGDAPQGAVALANLELARYTVTKGMGFQTVAALNLATGIGAGNDTVSNHVIFPVGLNLTILNVVGFAGLRDFQNDNWLLAFTLNPVAIAGALGGQ